MSLALLQRLTSRGVALPGAVALMAPWCDLRKNGDTFTTLTGIDPVLQVCFAQLSGCRYEVVDSTNGVDMPTTTAMAMRSGVER